jgi:hypothetical protein
MMTSPEKLCIALKSAPLFTASEWMEQLQERARQASGLSFLQDSLGNGLSLESISHGSHITSSEARVLISTLAQSSAARALSRLPSSEDPYGFRNCADEVSQHGTWSDGT